MTQQPGVAILQLGRPRAWTNQPLVLYHGTTLQAANNIRAHGVNLALARRRVDFGPGFYTTTWIVQAWQWANRKAKAVAGAQPVVLIFTVERDDIARLDLLAFVRGHPNADDYWSLVWHCRGGGDHARGAGHSPFYDVVFSPVATANWANKQAHLDLDQVSFHTRPSIDMLFKHGVPTMEVVQA